MKEDFKCCDVFYYIESDTVKEYRCTVCNKKFAKTKEGKWIAKK